MHAVSVESLAEKQKDVCSEKKMPVCIYTTPLCCFRYGLPVNFQAMLLQPNKKTVKKLREVLHELYKHLDSSAAAIIDVSTRQLSRRKVRWRGRPMCAWPSLLLSPSASLGETQQVLSFYAPGAAVLVSRSPWLSYYVSDVYSCRSSETIFASSY